MTNAIIDYFKGGNSLDTPEGHRLVSDSEDAVVEEAVADPEVAIALIQMMDNIHDAYLRRKMFKALGT